MKNEKIWALKCLILAFENMEENEDIFEVASQFSKKVMNLNSEYFKSIMDMKVNEIIEINGKND